MRHALIAVIITVIPPTSSFAADGKPSAKELVQRLASPNDWPVPTGGQNLKFAKSYDWKAQRVVDQAWNDLRKLGFQAIPELIQGLDDKRYCRTKVYAAEVSSNVGEECFRLLDEITNPVVTPDFKALPESQVRATKSHFLNRIGADGKSTNVGLSYLDLLIFRDQSLTRDSKSIGEWWKAFADKSLDQIHLTAIQRRIAYEEKVGFPPDTNGKRYLKPYRDLETQLKLRLQAK